MTDFLLRALHGLPQHMRPVDLVDIGIIAVCLYFVLRWIRRRGSWPMLGAIALLGLLAVLAERWDLYLTSQFFQIGLTATIFGLVLIFQDDFRRAFEHIASWNWRSHAERLPARGRAIQALVDSVEKLARDHVGALLVIKGRERLDRLIRGGVRVNGTISVPLIYSIFHPESPGHDGAVVIEDERIDQLGVHLPLSVNLAAVGEGGTRHTAALGLTERSDALVLVVSEERGTVSVAERGSLDVVEGSEALRGRLAAFFEQLHPASVRRPLARLLGRHLPLKLVALALASCLWLLFAYRVETVRRTYLVPIEYRNLPENWGIEEPRPTDARVTLSGAERTFRRLDPDGLMLSVDLSGAREGLQQVFFSPDRLRVPPGLAVSQIEPRVMWLQLYALTPTKLSVVVPLQGQLPSGKELGKIVAVPDQVKVLVRKSDAAQLKTIATEPVDLSKLRETGTLSSRLVLPKYARLLKEDQLTVQVTVPVRLATSQPEPKEGDSSRPRAPVSPPGG